MSASTATWLVAWVRDDGTWALVPDLMTQDEALHRADYSEQVLLTRAVAVDMDSLYEALARQQRGAA